MFDARFIGKVASISSCLEVSGYPKPGNVHRTRDFPDMVFEDFLISGVVTGGVIEDAVDHVLEIDDLCNANSGRYILEGVRETDNWIRNNTNLGILMLQVPIAQATAISSNFSDIRTNIVGILESSTVEDAVDLYDAINIADAGGMGSQDEYDVQSESAKEELRENGQTMFDVLKISSDWDQLAFDLTNGMPTVFDIGFKTFYSNMDDLSLNDSTLLTFLTILSKCPDTLISRKYGLDTANMVSDMANEVLTSFGTDSFKNDLNIFDKFLYDKGFNPGTTADLTAASIMLSFLNMHYKNK